MAPATTRRELVRGGILGGVGLLAWSVAEYVRVRKGELRSARWLAKDLNAVDRASRQALRWSVPHRADRLGDVLAYAVAPAICAWALRRPGDSLADVISRDGFAVTEAAVAAGLANQLAKQLAMRERPYADGVSKRVPLSDRFGSFFSGHTSSVAVISAATAFRRVCQGAPSKRLWVLPALPLVTGYLRIAADKHYLTDVLAGLAVGGVVALISTWMDPGLVEAVAPVPAPTLQ